MTRNEFEEAQRQSVEISKLLKEGNLAPEERQQFEVLQTQLAGILLSPWVPFGWGRRGAMVVLFLVGTLGLMAGNIYFLFAWLFMLCFSPRFVGECAYFLGKFSSGSNG